jgi:hypothetical protein
MKTNFVFRTVAAALFAMAVASSANALSISAAGNLRLNTDVAQTSFAVGAGDSDIRIWTDSYRAGINFDPAIALWKQAGGDYTFVASNDDDAVGVGSNQTAFDAGLRFASLGAGNYLVTLTATPYFALGANLSAGFAFDSAYGPIDVTEIALWNQPTFDLNTNNQKGTAWSLQVSAVPEPKTYALMLVCLVLIGFAARGRRPT